MKLVQVLGMVHVLAVACGTGAVPVDGRGAPLVLERDHLAPEQLAVPFGGRQVVVMDVLLEVQHVAAALLLRAVVAFLAHPAAFGGFQQIRFGIRSAERLTPIRRDAVPPVTALLVCRVSYLAPSVSSGVSQE